MADMHLQEESFKRAEKARLRNKLEERKLHHELDRKLHHELDRKHGIRATQEYRIKMMTKERRLIEKELDRINNEIRKPPPGIPAGDSFDINFDADSSPRADKKDPPLPARVRGRAMSIHEQSDRYTPTNSAHHPHLPTHPQSFRRPSQVGEGGGAGEEVPPLHHHHHGETRRPSIPSSQKAESATSVFARWWSD